MLLPLILSLGALASAAPASLDARAGVSDTANDMADFLSGKGKCAPVAVIFARGTFDSGNIGVWVGPQFFGAIKAGIPDVALQGVDAAAYPANLKGYIVEGGSITAASSLAKTVNNYAAKCKDTSIVISGWSQGALVAHKALKEITPAAQKQVKGFVTFGDPNFVWDNAPLPAFIPASAAHSECVIGSVPDPLCANLRSQFKFPTSVDDIVGPFKNLPQSFCVGAQQTKAMASLLIGFPGELKGNLWPVVKTLLSSKAVRLLLTPEHFTYGNSPMAKKAATFVIALKKATPSAPVKAGATTSSKASGAKGAKGKTA